MIHKDNTILILGCGGMLGEAVYKRFAPNAKVYATDIDISEPWLTYLDIRDKPKIDGYLNETQPDYIVHLAALTDMEYCQRHEEEAYDTNSQGAKNIVAYAREHDVPVVYVSTAGIFDGEKDAYEESDVPNPLSVYGKSKYEGERAIRTLKKHIVARAGWMMGGGPSKDKKFINKIITQLKTGSQDLHVIEDKLGTPCYTYDLANILYTLLDKEEWGVFHVGCEGGGSRHDVAQFLLAALNYDDKVNLHKVTSDHFRDTYFAPRPYSEKLLNRELEKRGYTLTRDWKECLTEYVHKFDWGL